MKIDAATTTAAVNPLAIQKETILRMNEASNTDKAAPANIISSGCKDNSPKALDILA